MTKLLIVEDDTSILDFVTYNLGKEGYGLVTARGGEEALRLFDTEKPGLVLLDVMIPAPDGFEVCRRLRAKSDVPILMLTARDDEIDRVLGLELGADDYVTKPFSMRELAARIKAVLRRYQHRAERPTDEKLDVGDLRMDLATREMLVGKRAAELNLKEFQILEMFMRNPNVVLERDRILDWVWGGDFFGDSRQLDVYIHRIREQIEDDAAQPKRLLTVRGVGYRLVRG